MQGDGRQDTRVYLSLGSNLGDRRKALTGAVALLDRSERVNVHTLSGIYETEPVGITNQPLFLNCAAELTTTLSASELLMLCKETEAALGRKASLRWGPRLIDIDILLYGNACIHRSSPPLHIPHPEMLKRAFVLVPLAEICPSLSVPGSDITVAEALMELTVNRQGKAQKQESIKPVGKIESFR